MFELQVLYGGASRLANHIQLTLERVLHNHIVAAAYENLTNHRLAGSHSRRHRHGAVDRNVAPAQQHLALGLDRALHFLLAGQARCVLLGQKYHADPVLARGRQADSLDRHLFPVQRVGQLDQNTGAIAHEFVGSHRAAMVQILENLQRVLDDIVGLHALDIGDKAHPTSVMLIGLCVQTIGL